MSYLIVRLVAALAGQIRCAANIDLSDLPGSSVRVLKMSEKHIVYSDVGGPMTTAKALRNAISLIPEGEAFVPSQFLSLSSRASIDQSLTRLTRSGEVVRLARGLYVRPKINKYVGPVTPEPAAIAAAVAKAHGAKIQVNGAEAARRLELTTQVPTQSVYYTTGPSRQIKVGRLQISLKHASPRRFALEGPAGLALSALRHVGRAHVTPEIIAQVKQQLPAEEFEALRTATTATPAWLSEALNRESRLRA